MITSPQWRPSTSVWACFSGKGRRDRKPSRSDARSTTAMANTKRTAHDRSEILLQVSLALEVQRGELFCQTAGVLLHGLFIPAGLRLQNLFRVLKIGILLIAVGTGAAAFAGHLQEGVSRLHNFDSWQTVWQGSRGGGSVICTCLYQVIWSYTGFSIVNYTLPEVQESSSYALDSQALGYLVVAILYVLYNLFYLAAASKEEITGFGGLVVLLLFKNVWGLRTERLLSGLWLCRP
ncbi:APC amino acid permease [Laccaria bicolor S238N-H82]|uniref:APC amino acid permease n=1 Tax=Laccaria bicolor (strain S238N-H82 / ATCC MYA-4686) TaxID=486041 RepID=B0DDR2_LACBS|nr:APC amino acid permease [Laccaria bicolor S238N-H82]EDR07256.1 APC amino acid permease [Laccaria bicolor S238N-H82]|eukprot:XP_001882187.1 APC amino acid permease [Laccaria bicolor S238N-H82]